MLAAESAWRILRAEHSLMRDVLGSIDEAVRSDAWKEPGQDLTSLRQLVEFFQTFDESTHRPKGLVLLALLRGRSPDTDRLLDRLQQESEQCDSLLAQALALIGAVEAGDPSAAQRCAAILAQHRKLMLQHLDDEDSALHSHTGVLLTPEEWSRVVSSISKMVHATAAARGA
jgi:hemerythrin-like domain-containing protein